MTLYTLFILSMIVSAAIILYDIFVWNKQPEDVTQEVAKLLYEIDAFEQQSWEARKERFAASQRLTQQHVVS